MNPTRILYLAELAAQTFALRTMHILQPYWDIDEWRIVRQMLSNTEMPSAIEDLEAELCRLTGAKYALASNLGRSAIQLALEAWNFPPDSEVIAPTFACTGVIMPIIQANLSPVLVDIDEDFNIDVASVRAALGPQTRAIILPHLSGKFARGTFKILELARKHALKVIDDACQAFGLDIDGQWAGTFGDVGVFSFGAGKTLFGPGGGALITNDDEIISSCRARTLPHEPPRRVNLRVGRFAWRYGMQRASYPINWVAEAIKARLTARRRRSKPPSIEHYRFSLYRISEPEAALALAQIKRYPEILDRMQANAQTLLEAEMFIQIGLQAPDSSNHTFVHFLVTSKEGEAQAQIMRRHLRQAGIETETTYTPLHLRAPFAHLRHPPTPRVEARWRGTFALPVNPRLRRREMQRIVDVLTSMQP